MIRELKLDFTRERKERLSPIKTSFPGFSPTRSVGRVGENPVNEVGPIIAPLTSYQQSLKSSKAVIEQLYRKLSPLLWNNTYMSDFLSGDSSCTTLLKSTEDCLLDLDLKKDVGMITIDLSKPFDSVCRNLLTNLRAYSCQESTIELNVQSCNRICLIVPEKYMQWHIIFFWIDPFCCGDPRLNRRW